MSLNLLPAEKISKRFYLITLLQLRRTTVDQVFKMATNMSWSIFMQHRQTNNNAEVTTIL